MLRLFLSANALDLSWSNSRIRITPRPAGVVRLVDRTMSSTVGLEDGQRAKEVRVNVYHRTPLSGRSCVYPVPPSRYPGADATYGDEGDTVLSVGSGERTVTTLRLGAEISSISQPRPTTSTPFKNGSPDTTAMGSGLYVVVGKDNKPIMPAQWNDMGGGLTVKLNDDRRSVTVVLSGMVYEHLAPYRICESDGKVDHPALYLFGQGGARVDIETLSLATGAKGTDDVTTIDNPAIDTPGKGWAAAQAAADTRVGSTLTLQRKGAPPPGGQTLGALVGARFHYKNHWWRISSTTTDETGVSLQATSHPLLADYNRKYPRVSDLPLAGRTLRDLSTEGGL